ncbi:TnsA endonuclease N-terminal domain-containing protein [Alicyclobacillus sp. SO9]|uniref:TnsA endonuclease N-terminal domain-containing protein n=1 Tax=Alicyclobacillus sp. SO9 TaxID=2665646 RepID=UPI0018E72F4D|nr:TnsA endonuclease N-terminal domain-containing protein [Alicyclobacillus sp. SO9]QQE78487.1 TnsA endonuclease N-terminal domain-containing protein [Alicyclobacillus sp. SO9]
MARNKATQTSVPGQMISKSDLTVRDVPSKGLSGRLRGLSRSEMHHLFSTLERQYFYCLLWSRRIEDICSQEIIPLETTIQIADRLGVKHPINPKTKELKPVSSDFVITGVNEGVTRVHVRSVKPEEELNKLRTVEKLEIERVYWFEKGIDWGLVTEKQINTNLAVNAQWVYESEHITPYSPVQQMHVSPIEHSLYEEIHRTGNALSHCALTVDHRLGLREGDSLWVAKYLICHRFWEVDMNVRIEPTRPVPVQRSALMSMAKGEQA